MKTLKGKIAIVTGGAQGLGFEICKALATDEMIVIMADINRDKADSAALKLTQSGAQVFPVNLDIRDTGAIRSVFGKIAADYGKIDALINNAAIDHTVSVESMSVQAWNDVIATNLTGPFLTTKEALPYLKRSRGGHIINIISTAAKRAWPNASAYHASKWGLLGFTHAMHTEMKQFSIKTTALIAGGMRTPFLLDRFPDIDVDSLQDPANVAATISFILSQPEGTVIPEIMVLPMRETSWP